MDIYDIITETVKKHDGRQLLKVDQKRGEYILKYRNTVECSAFFRVYKQTLMFSCRVHRGGDKLSLDATRFVESPEQVSSAVKRWIETVDMFDNQDKMKDLLGH